MTRLPEVISTLVVAGGAILDAASRAGGAVAVAPDRFDVSRALIYLWRKQVRAGLMPGLTISEAGAAAFALVAVIADALAPVHAAGHEVDQPRRGLSARILGEGDDVAVGIG